MILQIPYLFVEEKSQAYTIRGADLTHNIPDSSNVQALLDDAATRVVQRWSSVVSQGEVRLEAYTALSPIPNLLDLSMAQIEERVGDVNEEFFQSKVVHRPPELPLSLLNLESDGLEGNVLILLSPSAKRKLSFPSESPFDRLKRTKVTMTAPSVTAIPSTHEIMQQESSEKIPDDRPQPDADMPPIPLVHDGSGQILGILNRSRDAQVPGLSEVDDAGLRTAVNDFARKMCRFYTDDGERRSEALPALDRIFSARNGFRIPMLHTDSIGSANPAGQIVGEHGGATLVVVIKNWPTGLNTAIPEVELVGHVAHSHANGMEDHRDLFERWRVPCLGLTVVGPDVKFYAVVAVGHQYRLVGLTPTLSCIPSASDGRDRKALYSAFTAASVLQARILQDASKLLTTPPPKIPPHTHHFPAISRLRKYPAANADDYLSFQIQEFHSDRQSNRLLYFATTDKQTILVKFAKRYSIELHTLCAQLGHAPQILGFEILPGGWHAIAMEYIASGVPFTSSPRRDVHRDRWTTELLKLLDAIQDRGLVHGDLRDPNILSDDNDRVMLIDFDWGGKDGQVFYPTPNLNKELLEGRTRTDLKITKDDDRRVLKITLEKLKK